MTQMPNTNTLVVPRKLTEAEMSTLKANLAASREILQAAGWFLPANARGLSPLGPKSEDYVDNAVEIAVANEAALSGVLNVDEFERVHAVYEQAEALEDEMMEVLEAPHNVSLVAGAASKKFADDEYTIAKGFARLDAKWRAFVDKLRTRYEGQGPQKKKS